MPYGPTDYSQLDRMTNAVGQFNDREAQAAQALGQLRERAADRRQASGVLDWFRGQDISDVTKIPKIAAQAASMLTPGEPQQEAVGQTIHQTLQTAIAASNAQSEPKVTLKDYPVTQTPDEKLWPLKRTIGNSVQTLYQTHSVQGNKLVPIPGAYSYQTEGTNPSTTKDEAGARQERMDLQKQKDLYNLSVSSAKSYEDRFGKDTLAKWTDQLEKERPNLMAIVNDTSIPEEERMSRILAVGGTIDNKEERTRLTTAAQYAAASAKRDAYRKNIEDRGYYVNDAGNLVKGKAPKPKPQPTATLSAEDQQAVDWARANPNDPRAGKILQLHNLKQ